MSKTPADYLGKPYFPVYCGRWAGEFPHMAIVCAEGNRVLQRLHFSPDQLDSAWENACNIADQLNAQHER